MCELEGAVRLTDADGGDWQLENASGLHLQQVRIVSLAARTACCKWVPWPICRPAGGTGDAVSPSPPAGRRQA